MLIFATSPIASFSTSVRSASSSASSDVSALYASLNEESSVLSESPERSMPFNNAFISSWDNIPSSILSSILLYENSLLFFLSNNRCYSYRISLFIGSGKCSKFSDISHINIHITINSGIQADTISHLQSHEIRHGYSGSS